MGGDKNAVLYPLDVVLAIVSDLRVMLDFYLEIVMLKHWRQLFNSIVKGRRTAERLLMVEIGSARQPYKSSEIRRMGLI